MANTREGNVGRHTLSQNLGPLYRLQRCGGVDRQCDLEYFATQPKLSSKQMTWQDTLALFNVIIRHKPRNENIMLDALSRKHQLRIVTTPLWVKGEDETHTPESANLESSRTPKNSELDCMGQNTFHWGFLYINRKVLKCRGPKWPCMGHLDICSPSYGKKKGRESNWQFDSRPLKVKNQPLPDVYR